MGPSRVVDKGCRGSTPAPIGWARRPSGGRMRELAWTRRPTPPTGPGVSSQIARSTPNPLGQSRPPQIRRRRPRPLVRARRRVSLRRPTRLPRLVASAGRKPWTKRRRRERPRRVGRRLPARVRPSRATRAKVRPLWRIEGDPRMGRPRTMRLPARKRRQRLPMRSRDRRSRRPPPRLPGSRRHLALRRRPISAPPRSGPHPLTPSPRPGRTHRRPVNACPPPTGLRRLRATSPRRPPNRHRASRPLHRGPGSATPRPVRSKVGERRRPPR
jgi:hypothetical protein